jgi:hypothetical protein
MKELNEIIDKITNIEMYLYAKRDDGEGLTDPEKQILEMLNFAYELFVRSEIAINDPENLVPDFDDNGTDIDVPPVYRHAVTCFPEVEKVVAMINALPNKGSCIGF